MKKLFFALIVFVLMVQITFPQERMIVKPYGFNPNLLPKIQEVYITSKHETRIIDTEIGKFSIDSNIRIVPTSGNQTELSATIWTKNPNYVFIGANSDPGQGYYYTTDGGTTWGGGDLLPGSVSISSDPACAFDDSGKIHFNYFDYTMVSDRSTNGGANWTGRVTIPSSGNFDKNHNTVDVVPGSPYYGRVYVVWSDFSAGAPPTVLSYSTDGGSSYSPQQQIGQPLSGHYEQGCNIQVGPTGTVYCVWACPLTTPPWTEDYIGFTKSTNGGVNWTTPTIPLAIHGIRGYILSTNIRTNSFPSMAIDRTGGSRNGYIYITWAQKDSLPAGTDPDICFAYSSDDGSSWSTPVRVNDDSLSNGKNQFFPWMTVDQATGTIGIVFYDTRDVSSTDSCNTYCAFSTDGGTSWVNMLVSDHAQRPAPLSGYADGYYGDYIAITGYNNVFWPLWMDNRPGVAQVYTSKIMGPPFGIKNNQTNIPSAYKLKQNYPNPFNPVTTINYELPTSNLVKIFVYNILGEEVKMLVNQSQQAGIHHVQFDGSNLPSGVYLYKLIAGDFIDVKKMMMIK